MSDELDSFKTCEECGATIYPEHLENRLAEQFEGQLLCVHCVKARRAAASPDDKPADDGSAPIALVDEDDSDLGDLQYDTKPTVIKSFGGGPGGMGMGGLDEDKLRRNLLTGSPNATRCRTFHCKLADGPITHLNEQINEWADSNDNIEIKFATSCIGVIEGKHVDPHLIVTVFY